MTTTSTSTVANEHEVKESFTVDVWYPNHEPRTVSNTFNRTKHQLIDVEDTPCWICGSKENREVHHFIIEWAYADAIDWSKVKAEHPTFDWANFKTAEDFVDGIYNMRVLCETHHRGVDHGIHTIPYPIWQVQKFVKDDFKMYGLPKNPPVENKVADAE
jgi:hypothetical protein